MAEKDNINPTTEPAPDPDEDDLDDLDDVLDEFAPTASTQPKPAPATAAPASSGPGRPEQALPTAAGPQVEDEEFAKQLEAGMAEFLGQMQSSPEMQKQFEDLLKGLGDVAAAVPPGDDKPPASAEPSTKTEAASSAKQAEDSFQETIRKTMERMQESGEQASAAAAQGDESAELEQLLKALMNSEGGAEGVDDNFAKMLSGVFEQLANKDILYEAMKDLDGRFDDWLEKHEKTTSKEDYARYKEQRKLVTEIIQKYEQPGYSDEKPEDKEYIVEKMAKMQELGSPPQELVGDITTAPTEALEELDSTCAQQ